MVGMRSIAVLLAIFTSAEAAACAKKRSVSSWKDQMLFRERLIAGAGARGVAQTVLHPIDVARTRLQAKGVEMTFTPKTFVKGVVPQFVLAFPAGALQFASYEFCKAKAAAVGVTGGLAEVRAPRIAPPTWARLAHRLPGGCPGALRRLGCTRRLCDPCAARGAQAACAGGHLP